MHIGLSRLEVFSAMGDFSARANSPRESDDFEERYAKFLLRPEDLNRKLSILRLGCGKADTAAHPATLQVAESLKSRGIQHTLRQGGHRHTLDVYWAPGGSQCAR